MARIVALPSAHVHAVPAGRSGLDSLAPPSFSLLCPLWEGRIDQSLNAGL